MAPNAAIKTAPMQTRMVPKREYLVNDSPRIKVANIVLKTSPDCVQPLVSFIRSIRREPGTIPLEGLKGQAAEAL